MLEQPLSVGGLEGDGLDEVRVVVDRPPSATDLLGLGARLALRTREDSGGQRSTTALSLSLSQQEHLGEPL